MSCRPPVNTTYLTIGQDLFSISEYVNSQYNYSLHHAIKTNSTLNDTSTDHHDGLTVSNFVPSAFMVYTDLAGLKGLWSPTDYGSGIEYADGALNLFPQTSTGLQIGLWLNGTQGCFSICAGEMDEQIQKLISYLEHCRSSKIFLRLGYEFDNPSFGYSEHPEMYQLAFRKIVNDCRESLSKEALQRVLFVWHSWAAPMAKKTLSLEKFYPGDDYVDWIGVSIFQQVFPWSPGWGGQISDVENVLDFAKKHDKPTIIAESTPFGGIELKQASNETKLYLANNEYNHDEWNRWYGKVIDIINKYDVSMWCYINCDWENQPMWHNVGFGQTLLSSNERVMKKWYEKITNNGVAGREFLFAGSLDDCGTTKSDQIGESSDHFQFGLSHFYSFILVPFMVASGAFFIPYLVLSGQRKKNSSEKERKPLLSNMDEPSTRRGVSLSTIKPKDNEV